MRWVDLGAFLVAFFVSLVAAKPLLAWLARIKSRQTVYAYAPATHQVKQGTPTMGGLIILAGFVAWMFAWLLYRRLPTGPQYASEYAAVVTVITFAIIGFLDDYAMARLFPGKRGLSWKPKLLLEILACMPAVACFGLPVYPSAAIVLTILFCANAYNFADGIDGLAATILILLCAGIVALRFGGATEVDAAAIIGATVPFWYLNWHPAKVFMGDVGALAIGAFLGVAAVEPFAQHARSGGSAPTSWAPMLILYFVLVVELVPVPLQIGCVKLFKRKLFPFTPIHHAFEKAGWSEIAVVRLFLAAQGILSLAAVLVSQLTGQGPSR